MRLLPNLSLLSLKDGSKRKEEAVGVDFVPPTTPVNVSVVDWMQLMEAIRGGNRDISFLVKNQSLTLRIVAEQYASYGTRFLVKSADENYNHCVEVVILNWDAYAEDAVRVKLDSLFYGLSDTVLATCQMQPTHSQTSGAGSTVIEIFQSISARLGQWMILTDSASPIERSGVPEIPVWMQGASLTTTHSIVKGAGYYQRRGFMPKPLVKSVVEAYTQAMTVQPLAFLAGFYILQSVLLLWTELIFNTPINHIADAVRTRFFPILQSVQATQSAAFPNLPPASEHPIFNLFSRQNLEWHADYLEKGLAGSAVRPINELKLEIDEAAEDTDSDPARFGATSFHEFSIRRLMQMATQENSIFQQSNGKPLDIFKREVFSFADRAWRYVNGKEVYTTKLVCPLLRNNGAAGFIGVVNSAINGNVPTADFVPVNNNFTVEFEASPPAPQPPQPLQPLQPPRSFINNEPGAGGIEELEE